MQHDLEFEGSNIGVPPPEAAEQVGINEAMVEEVPADRGHDWMHAWWVA